MAIQAGSDRPPVPESASLDETDASDHSEFLQETTPKTLDLQYFLEMVDVKHRHGSNLRAYHMQWKNSPSSENFFYWLDYGAGKEIDLPQCPREKLEKQQVRYLSPEERLNYLVKVDNAGLFRWAKNNELVDTNSRRFKDSLRGVVRVEDDIPRFQGNVESPSQSSPEPVSSPAPESSPNLLGDADEEDDDDDVDDDKNPRTSTREDYELAKAVKKFARVKPAAIYDHLAGSLPTKEGMWIFVSCFTHLDFPIL